MTLLFIEGAALGFAISAPVGPINLLCMRRSLTHGKRVGFLTGLGAATGDAFYGAVAAFGLTAISDFFVHYQNYFQLFGGALFFGMGLRILRAKPPVQADVDLTENTKVMTGTNAFISTLFLTMTNPATILAFLTAFASLKFAVEAEGFIEPAAITLGVFAGSAAWWLILSQLSAKFATRLTPETLVKINKAAGALLIVFGCVLLYHGVIGFT